MRPMRALLMMSLVAVLGCGDDDGRVPLDVGPGSDSGPGLDGGPDAMPTDGGGVDASERDSGGVDAGGVDAGGRNDARVDRTFSGCGPRFDGDVVVVRNSDSIAVSATHGGTLTGSVQLDLMEGTGTYELSTRHRVDSGSVVNVIVSTTWTNIARDSAAVLSEGAPDPIGGRLVVRAYDEAAGVIDMDFVGVTLQNPSDSSVCRVDGTLETFRLSF